LSGIRIKNHGFFRLSRIKNPHVRLSQQFFWFNVGRYRKNYRFVDVHKPYDAIYKIPLKDLRSGPMLTIVPESIKSDLHGYRATIVRHRTPYKVFRRKVPILLNLSV
jgi:hypothetical protein